MKQNFWMPERADEKGFLSFCYIAGFRVERLVTRKRVQFSIGPMDKALIKFESEKSLYKFLTV